MFLQPTLRMDHQVTLSTYREFLGRYLEKNNCRESATPASSPRYGGPQLSPKGGGEPAGRGRQIAGSFLEREATRILLPTRVIRFLN